MSEIDSEITPVSTNQAQSNQWIANHKAALAARLAMFVLPVAAGLLVMVLVPFGTAISLVFGLVAAAATDRLSRQLGPLSTLYELTLTFPEHAPSRWAIAKRVRSSDVEQELLSIGTGDNFEPEAPQAAAERSLVLVGLLDRHDKLTGGHSARVSRYASMTAEAMGLPSEERNTLAWAALLHDIGKLKISADILARTHPLTEAERATLLEHPGNSADLMRSLFEWLGESFGAATEHHERFDGTGYPLQLEGTEISIAGRITAVCDAFDAMTASNSYRKSMSVSDARSELLACAGSQFDPAVVRAFVNLSLDKQWARPLGWVFDTPGLAVNAFGLAPLAVAALLLGFGVVGGAVSSSDEAANDVEDPPPSQLAAIAEDDAKKTPSTTSPGVAGSSVGPDEAVSEPTTTSPVNDSADGTETQVEPPETASPAGADNPVQYPSASDDAYSTGPTEWVSMTVLDNDDSGDFDWDFATLDFYIEPENGDKWEALADGTLRYRPLSSFVGPETFSYVVCNTGGHCAIGTVVVNVQEN